MLRNSVVVVWFLDPKPFPKIIHISDLSVPSWPDTDGQIMTDGHLHEDYNVLFLLKQFQKILFTQIKSVKGRLNIGNTF